MTFRYARHYGLADHEETWQRGKAWPMVYDVQTTCRKIERGCGRMARWSRIRSMFYFTTRKARAALQQQGKRVIDVSSRAPLPYRYLSPFYPHGNLPIPGMPGRTADAVEGIWQGLKVFQECIDEAYFRGRGKKRRGKPEGHLYEGKVIAYLHARQLIYVPAYRCMVSHTPHARDTALALLQDGRHQEIFLHDFDWSIYSTKISTCW